MKKKCAICKKAVENLEQHLLEHIDTSYKKEIKAFQETQEARALYRKIFKKDI